MERLEVMSVGSANMDLVVKARRFPVAGETLTGSGFGIFAGGKGANQAVAAGKLGARVGLVAKLGQDAFADELIQSLESASVDTRWILRDAHEATGVALITVDASGQNTIVVAPGTNALLTPQDVRSQFAQVEFRVLLAQLEIPMESVLAVSAHAGERTFILNPAPARDAPEGLLATVDYLTPNENEAESLTGIRPKDDASCMRAGAALLDRGVKNAIFTLGARGSYLVNRAGGRHFRAMEVKAVDTTGAGDAFNGALACFLSRGETVERSIELANIAGALSTTRAGAQASMPSCAELMEHSDRARP